MPPRRSQGQQPPNSPPIPVPQTVNLWCYAKALQTFEVTSPTNINIYNLRIRVHKEGDRNVFRDVNPADLAVFQLNTKVALKPKRTLAERIPRDHASLQELEDNDLVSEIFPAQPSVLDLHLLVEIRTASTGQGHVGDGHTLALEEISGDQLPDVKFKFVTPGSFGGSDGLRLNEISEAPRRPAYINDFITELRRKRKLFDTNPHLPALKKLLPVQFDNLFEVVLEVDPADDTSDPVDDTADKFELTHYMYHYGTESQHRSSFLDILGKEYFAGLWIGRPIKYMEHVLDECTIALKPWSFPIIGKLDNEDQKYHKFTPMNDFHLAIQGFPYILLAVISDETYQSDRYRMLIQASCLARLANMHHNTQDAIPFVVMAIYFDKTSFQRYLVFQPNKYSIKTEYIVDEYPIIDRYKSLLFFIELYNYPSIARRLRRDLDDPTSWMTSEAAVSGLPSFHPLTKRAGKKRARESDGDRNEQPPPGATQPSSSRVQDSVFDDPVVRRKLSSMRYNVAEAFIEAGIEPLDRISIKPHVSIATYSDEISPANAVLRRKVVLKFVDDTSDERSILEHLATLTSNKNHTVDLLQTIEITRGYILAFPYLRPLPLSTPIDENNVISLAHQFVDGVAFMHQNSIAHLDLKPDNILVNMDDAPHHLWITDFSISILVKDEDDLTEGYFGTPGWVAPEIGQENEAPHQYSAIRADRWSWGQMLRHFQTFGPGFKEPSLEKLSRLLLNKDPGKRPSLVANLEGEEEPERKRRRGAGKRLHGVATRR